MPYEAYDRELAEHCHAMLHAVLQLQGATKDQIDQLLKTQQNTAEWEALVATLKKPTEAVDADLKANP